MAPVELQTEQPPPEQPRSVVGIIYPPPEVRNIVDKTASFVARNGPEFEARIRQNEIENTKFNFLNVNDPYHAYYRQKVKDFAEGKALEGEGLKISAPSLARAPMDQQEIQKKIAESFIPKEPPAEYEYMAEPPSINALELDVVKLTAQFVARNGRQFLTQLMNREQRNSQFDFLRPQHSMFSYFTKLVEQYTKVLIPPKDLQTKLQGEASSYKDVMQQVNYRVEWERWQDRERRREEEAAERERMAYAQIDWHDFIIVETVDFLPHEAGNFPPPTTPEEVGKRLLAEERGVDITLPGGTRSNHPPVDLDIEKELLAEAAAEEEAEQALRQASKDHAPPPPPESSEKNQMQMQPPAPPIQAPAKPGQVLVRRDYDPKLMKARVENQHFLVSPITGERIPDSQVGRHVHIGLLDPHWIQQKEREAQEKAHGENIFAPGVSVDETLKNLAERRTDIFGIGKDETFIGQKLGSGEQEDRGDSMVWDGHSASKDAVIKRNAAPPSSVPATSSSTKSSDTPHSVPSNIVQAGSMPPVLAAPPVPMAPRPVMMPPRPPIMMMPSIPMLAPQQPTYLTPAPPPTYMVAAPMMQEEPPSKKAKTENDLMPEDMFLRTQPNGPCPLRVFTPNMPEKTDMNLHGQVISLSLPLTEPVSTLKNRLADNTSLPAAKQKLSVDGLFMKDTNTLAFYNVTSSSMLQLQLKERGGRRK